MPFISFDDIFSYALYIFPYFFVIVYNPRSVPAKRPRPYFQVRIRGDAADAPFFRFRLRRIFLLPGNIKKGQQKAGKRMPAVLYYIKSEGGRMMEKRKRGSCTGGGMNSGKALCSFASRWMYLSPCFWRPGSIILILQAMAP